MFMTVDIAFFMKMKNIKYLNLYFHLFYPLCFQILDILKQFIYSVSHIFSTVQSDYGLCCMFLHSAVPSYS